MPINSVKGKDNNWIERALKGDKSKNGNLRNHLGVKWDKKVTAKQLAPKKWDTSKVKKEKVLANTLKGFRK